MVVLLGTFAFAQAAGEFAAMVLKSQVSKECCLGS